MRTPPRGVPEAGLQSRPLDSVRAARSATSRTRWRFSSAVEAARHLGSSAR